MGEMTKLSIEFLTNPIDLSNLQMAASSSSSSPSPSPTPSSNSSSSSSSSSSTEDMRPIDRKGKRRRQRAGPSCDHCRSRKVKCDAVIQILKLEELEKVDRNLFQDESRVVGLDYQQNKIYKLSDDWRIVKTKLDNSVYSRDETKYIKFKICRRCFAKDWNCLFSKGFTRIHSVPSTVSMR